VELVSTSDRPTQEVSDRFGHLVAPSYEVVEGRSTKTLGRDIHEVFQSCTELVHLLDDLLGQRACYRTDQVSQDLLVVEDANQLDACIRDQGRKSSYLPEKRFTAIDQVSHCLLADFLLERICERSPEQQDLPGIFNVSGRSKLVNSWSCVPCAGPCSYPNFRKLPILINPTMSFNL
jgi:hypothetical protein